RPDAEAEAAKPERLMRRTIVAGRGLAAGLLLTASVTPVGWWGLRAAGGRPPVGWWVLGRAGAALLADSLVRLDGWRMRLLAGAATGLTLYAVGWFWMSEFSAPGYVVAVFIEVAILSLASVT